MHVGFGVVLGWVVSKVVSAPTGHTGTIQAAVALPNPTAVPFVLISALQKNIIPEHVQLKLGPAGDPLVYLTVCVHFVRAQLARVRARAAYWTACGVRACWCCCSTSSCSALPSTTMQRVLVSPIAVMTTNTELRSNAGT